MYQAPFGVRTEAWKPSGLTSAWIVAVGSSIPLPLKVAISGCFAARPGAMMSLFASEKRWNEPVGSGSETTTPCGFAFALAEVFGAALSSASRPFLSSLKASSETGRTSARAPSWEAGRRSETLIQNSFPALSARPPGPTAETAAAVSATPAAIATTVVAMRLPRTDPSAKRCPAFPLMSPFRSVWTFAEGTTPSRTSRAPAFGSILAGRRTKVKPDPFTQRGGAERPGRPRTPGAWASSSAALPAVAAGVFFAVVVGDFRAGDVALRLLERGDARLERVDARVELVHALHRAARRAP